MARTLLISGSICVVSFIVIGVTGKKANEQSPSGLLAPVGGTTVVEIETKFVCLQGHHRVANAGTTLRLEDGTELDCETLAISNKPWEDSIKTTTWTYRGKEVVETGHKELEVKLRISIPDRPELVGQSGQLVASGSVIYPYAPRHGKQFEERAGDFSTLRPVSLVTPEEAEASERQPLVTSLFVAAFMLSAMVFIGTVMVRIFR